MRAFLQRAASAVSGAFGARPSFLSASVLVLLVPLALSASLYGGTWSAAPGWVGSDLVPERAALLFEGDLLSGEGAELVAGLARAAEVQVSWFSVPGPDGMVLSDGPPRSRSGRVVVTLPPAGLAAADALGRSAAAPFPSVSFVRSEAWSYEPSPPVWGALASGLRMLPLLLVIVPLMLVLYPVLDTYSRLRHLMRAAVLSSYVVFAAVSGVVAASLLMSVLTGYGSGHDFAMLFPASFALAVLAASLPAFWASRLESEGSPRAATGGAALAVGAVLPSASAMVALGVLLSALPSGTVFGAAGSLVAGSGAAAAVAVSVSSALVVLAGLRPAGEVRAQSALSVALLSAAPRMSRLLSRRLFAALLVLASVGAAAVSVSSAPRTGMARPASVLFEVSSLAGDAVGEVAAAEVVSRAVGSGVVARAYELFSAGSSSRLFVGEMLPLSSSPDRDLSRLGVQGVSAVVTGGSYLDWVSWVSSFSLALVVAFLAAALVFAAASAVLYHVMFYLSRVALVAVAASLALLPLLALDASDAHSTRALPLLAVVSLWAVAFGVEAAREMDSGADGATAAASAAAAALPLVAAPLSVLAASAPSSFVPLGFVALSATLSVVVAAALVGPRESLRA